MGYFVREQIVVATRYNGQNTQRLGCWTFIYLLWLNIEHTFLVWCCVTSPFFFTASSSMRRFKPERGPPSSKWGIEINTTNGSSKRIKVVKYNNTGMCEEMLKAMGSMHKQQEGNISQFLHLPSQPHSIYSYTEWKILSSGCVRGHWRFLCLR